MLWFVRIALKRPDYDVTYHQIRTSDHELSKAKNSWLNLLAISLNYNETDFEKKSTSTANQYVYPKYFFGITIPVGLIFTRSSDIKIARENQAIARDHQLELVRTIRADVQSKYRSLLNYQAMLAVQNIIVTQQQAEFLQEEKNFKDAKIGIEIYNTASKNFNNEILRQIQYKMQMDQVKVDLEQILGMPLEDAIKL